jgi:hypothetical protein
VLVACLGAEPETPEGAEDLDLLLLERFEYGVVADEDEEMRVVSRVELFCLPVVMEDGMLKRE